MAFPPAQGANLAAKLLDLSCVLRFISAGQGWYDGYLGTCLDGDQMELSRELRRPFMATSTWFVMIPPTYASKSTAEKDLYDFRVQYPAGSQAWNDANAGKILSASESGEGQQLANREGSMAGGKVRSPPKRRPRRRRTRSSRASTRSTTP